MHSIGNLLLSLPRILRNFFVGVLFLGIFISCQKKDPKDGFTYLIPWPDGAGRYTLQEVTLYTLSSHDQMKGAAAEVHSDQGFIGEGLAGVPARPRLTEVNGVFIPQDAESSFAVTVYAHFERLKLFEEEHQLSTALSWPRKVGINVPMLLLTGGFESNNARYYMDNDVIGVSPFVGGGLPMAINAGILAHEHFHAIFERLFMQQLGENVRLASDGVQLVLRSWNEGLADFFAFIYTNDPSFMNNSVMPEIQEARRLDRSVMSLKSSLQLAADAVMLANDKTCHKGFCFAYGEGTKVARMLYQIWLSLPEERRWEFARELLSNLPNAATEVTAEYKAKNALSLTSLIPFVLDPMVVSESATCKSLILLVGRNATFLNSFEECAVNNVVGE